jgi:hypothetical protein
VNKKASDLQLYRCDSCYYLQYRDPRPDPAFGSSAFAPGNGILIPLPGPPVVPADTIERMMRWLHGHTVTFSNAEQFAAAVDKVAN